ncbi:ROK family transcriptional regulator [Gayadomonas joobiniege]|uniref:ROK family transcriptional regulator n=1 Tax=Gayadomonas joobiniege TaxID=1234606 RepID=UPI0004751B88|nr:ROK family transcriptional regulator [Gayadomonas joobiniege]
MHAKNLHGGRSQTGLRAHNERQILSLIRRFDALPKAQIAKSLGLSAQAVTVITNDLLAAGLIKKQPPKKGKVGKPIEPLSLCANGAYGLGLRVDRKIYQMTLVDFAGQINAQVSLHIDYPKVDSLMTFVSDAYRQIVQSVPSECQSRILGLGVATPYQLWAWPEAVGASKEALASWQAFDFETELKALIGLPVYLCNDDTAACSAELCFANSQRLQHFMYLYIGPFIGGGLVLNQQIYYGQNNNAGALGSMPVSGDKGAKQLIEEASLYLLENDLKVAGFEASLIYYPESSWSGFENILKAWLMRAANAIAQAALASMALLDLQAVVIDGAIPPAVKSQLIEAVQQKISQSDQRGIAGFRILPGTLGYQAQTIGSANLPIMQHYY